MKIKNGFILKDIAGTPVVVPIGQRVVEFNCMITLSESGALLWKRLETGAEHDELINVLMEEYSVDEIVAHDDVEEFIEALNGRGLLES